MKLMKSKESETLKFKPGSVMPPDTQQAIAAPPPCKHLRLVPLEFAFAKVIYPNGHDKEATYDYATAIMSANVCRVKMFLCLDCQAEIKSPKRKE